MNLENITPNSEPACYLDATSAQSPCQLAATVQTVASSGKWVDRVRLRAGRRWYERIHLTAEFDVWLISWMPGQATGFHDHGISSGAFVVVAGELEERRLGAPNRVLRHKETCTFGPDYAHDVLNASQAPAISIHAYSPPLTNMNEYELEEDRLVPRPSENDGWQARESEEEPNALSVDQLLASARSRLNRLSPADVQQALADRETVLVDIRPERQRFLEGSIEDAIVIERNVLEWRLDPKSSARLSFANTHNLQVIVMCSEGYTSSLAAAALQELGLRRATDMVGGIRAWKEAGFPVTWQKF